METRICQNCKNNFTIEAEDFSFYEKIKVPPPTFCPECRTIRRLTWRNEMTLCKRKCDAPDHNETIISIYNPEEKVVVYDIKYWWSDDWDPMSYGKDYDFSKSFFEQWGELYKKFPLQSLSNSKATNSDYCNISEQSKDSYMSSGSWNIERTFYSNRIMDIKDSSDLYVVHNSELCYEDIMCADCYHVLYSFNCKNCVDSYFLYDCHGCTNCFGCTNLRNKSYCWFNEQLSKEEYIRRFNEINLLSYKTITELRYKFNYMYMDAIHRFANHIKVINSTGDNLEGVKDSRYCFDATGQVENSKYVHWVKVMLKDVYDSGPGVGMGEMMYETFDTGIGNFRNLFTSVVYSSNEIEYAFNCYSCSNLFGCIGLRSKKYCILNKQYTKEEYEELIPKIKQHMLDMPYIDKLGRVYRYGEFFPSELSPFAYNETVAQDYFPISNEEMIKRGNKLREKSSGEYLITLNAVDIPDNLIDINDSITKEIIGCIHQGNCQDRCSKAYRITVDELSLYKRLGVPIPKICFGCRHDARLRKRNPMKLWHRSCMCEKVGHNHKGKCQVEFETSYAPERPEIIYCEKCYQQEVI